MQDSLAPRLRTTQWFNAAQPLDLAALKGRVVVVHFFQMLCPGCVSHGLPQAREIHAAFDADDVAVIGIHSVFEHHDVMTPKALEAFIHEYRLEFPIGVDAPAAAGPVPLTMQAYGLRGTPSVVLLDREQRVRLHQFGRIDDLRLGAAIGALRAEPRIDAAATPASNCDADGCALKTATS